MADTVTASMNEQTQAQITTGAGEPFLPKAGIAPAIPINTSGSLPTSGTLFYRAVREMRKHPTAALARQLCIAPLLAAEWTIGASDLAPVGAKELIEKQILPLKLHLLKTSLLGCMDYGWQSYEKVFRVDSDGTNAISKVKPLIPDITDIVVDPDTGAFNGVRNGNIALKLEDTLLVNMEVEGTNWYGESFSAVLNKTYNEWNNCNDAAVRYDKKLAGAHWVVHYPKGSTKIDGQIVDNYLVAKDVVAALQSSGSIIVCKGVEGIIDGLNGDTSKAWEIEIKSAYPTANVAFIDRLKYLDALMARAYGLPERAVLEGEFGTKAEAEAHADFAITNMELRHRLMVLQYNWHLVNHILRLNYGEEAQDTVQIKVSPITDINLQFLRTVYTTILTNISTATTEAPLVDMEALREQVGIPTKSEGDQDLDPLDPNAKMPGDVVTGDELPVAAALSQFISNLNKSAI